MAQAKIVDAVVVAVTHVLDTLGQQSQALLLAFLNACGTLDTATHAQISEGVKRSTCSTASKTRGARIMRALMDVKGKARDSRAAQLAKCSDLKAAAALCSEKNWGGAVSKAGAVKKAGRPKDTAAAKGESKAAEDAVAGLRKLTMARLIEFVAQRAAKNPDFRAKLLRALNAEETAEA